MTMQTETKVLDNIMAVHLEVNIWTARKKLSATDFGGASLPPEDLASLGSKRVCDPEALKVFGTLKARAVNLLERHGVRFLGGWAIPVHMAEHIHMELLRIRQAFDDAKEAFLDRYDEAVRDWITKHSGWERIIEDSTVSADQVRSRMGFQWQFYRIQNPEANDSTVSGIVEEVRGLGGVLFGETAKAATDAWHKCFAGRTEITRKALSPLRTILQKLKGLSFVEPRVAPVAELIETAIDSLPKKGKITGSSLLLLQGLVCLLRDTDALLEHGQKVMDGTSPDDVLELLVGRDGWEVPIPDIGEMVGPLPTMPTMPEPVLPSYGLW